MVPIGIGRLLREPALRTDQPVLLGRRRFAVARSQKLSSDVEEATSLRQQLSILTLMHPWLNTLSAESDHLLVDVSIFSRLYAMRGRHSVQYRSWNICSVSLQLRASFG